MVYELKQEGIYSASNVRIDCMSIFLPPQIVIILIVAAIISHLDCYSNSPNFLHSFWVNEDWFFLHSDGSVAGVMFLKYTFDHFSILPISDLDAFQQPPIALRIKQILIRPPALFNLLAPAYMSVFPHPHPPANSCLCFRVQSFLMHDTQCNLHQVTLLNL